METATDIVTGLGGLSVEQLNGLIALGGLLLAGFAIYVVFTIARRPDQ